MKLRTEIEIARFRETIGYADRLFAIGSCFAQSIGGALKRSKFSVEVNPTGTLFHPLSIASTLERLHCGREIRLEELREGRDGFYHDDFHSMFNRASAEDTLLQINSAIARGREALLGADWVVLTLGTAWIYERADGGALVANCHKEPSCNFVRRRATVEQIVARLGGVIRDMLSTQRILITLSPIRHVADGLSENSLSKATLRLAIDELCREFGDRIYYFPAYEILLDDLRDYRFYGEDMVHPSSVAVEYIWGKFCEAVLSEGARERLPRVERVVRAVEHRPISPLSDAYATFCRSQLSAIASIEGVDFSDEVAFFENRLSQLEKKL